MTDYETLADRLEFNSDDTPTPSERVEQWREMAADEAAYADNVPRTLRWCADELEASLDADGEDCPYGLTD